MSTFSAAIRGTGWALIAQIVIGFGQIAYAALTARVFSPSAFGEFTAALSLHGLIVLCAATGLSSFILKEQHLHRSQIRAINLVVFSVALPSAVVYWFVSPVWLAWLNSPGGAQFVPLLAWATFAAPIGTVQSALLRREGDGRADAMVYIAAFTIATGLAAVLAILSRESWTLAIGTAINPVILIVLSRISRRAAYPVGQGVLSFDWLLFAVRVAGQNLVFFVLGQVPTWSLGATSDPATLGQFSRGNTLAFVPAFALSTAINRGVQPHWRKVETDDSRIRAISEALVLGASVSFTGFFVLAALSRPLTGLWLGPGWDLAAEFAAWFAIGFAMQVPSALLANYLEMTAALSRVHWIQFANAVSLALGVALLALSHDYRFLLGGFVLSHLAGLVTAVRQVSAAVGVGSWWLVKELVAPLISAFGSAGVAFGSAHIVAVVFEGGATIGNAAQLCGGLFAVIAFLIITRKWQPALSIAARRGVLKRLI